MTLLKPILKVKVTQLNKSVTPPKFVMAVALKRYNVEREETATEPPLSPNCF